MKIIVSNKLEILAEHLAEELNEPLTSPLASETIVIQSTGMQKWLSLELARRHGICANYKFPFPNAFIDNVFKAFIADYEPDLSYIVDVLTWKIMEILPELNREEDFQPVRNYLGENNDQLKLYGLARRIAATFDQYMVFRPEMILAWEEGIIRSTQERWQALLWQKIVKSQGNFHKARLRELFLAAANNESRKKDLLPERISIFGISYLPPYHLEIFSRLSRHIPVNIYYLNPSPEFWADIKSDREIGLTLQKSPGKLGDFDDDLLHLESGNRLLASMGSIGRDFFRQISTLDADYVELFDEPQENNLLSAIQSDIYLLVDRGKNGNPFQEVSSDDKSIQIHSCHGPLREVESLHNTLLGLLKNDDKLIYKDILVMTPHIESYAPYIEAVFESRSPKIPYSIADRSGFSGSTVAKGFFNLLNLVSGRFTANEVLTLLENHAIAEKFGISAQSMELIRRWVASTNIKWGVNGEHRKEFNLPEFSQNTWQGGINSMLAGIALDGRRRELFYGICPYGEIEGDKTEILGSFLDFWTALIKAKNILSGLKPLENWCQIIKKVITDFFPVSEEYRDDLYKLREMINRLALQIQSAKTEMKVDLNVIKKYLQQSSNSVISSSRYLSGSVTFCEMLPLRSIPFDVICLIGMDNEAYPRKDNNIGFDLSRAKRRIGDRSLRGEDQYLFLEAILSARKNLIISYTGQDLHDNSEILPSALVSDLLDYIDQGFTGPDGENVSSLISARHHLHEFHPEYFTEHKKLFSYSQENYKAALALGTNQQASSFINGELEFPEQQKEITINDLIDFYKNPIKYFLEKRLCLKIPQENYASEESEPFIIDSLDKYKIKQELLEKKLLNLDAKEVYEICKAEGVFPVGAAGDYHYTGLESQLRDFAQTVDSVTAGKEPAKIPIDIAVHGLRITGTIDNLYGNNFVHYRPAKLKVSDYIRTWICHLLINVNPESGAWESILLGEDAQCRFDHVDSAENLLEGLIDYYKQGQVEPLKFFPRTSWEYANNVIKKQKNMSEALYAASLVWSGDGNGWDTGEAQEVANKICFADTMPLNHEFESIAKDIFGPLFSCLEKLEI
ncbi:MAG: exodeoxyribonuclease V subunit gamma [Smithella sp.]